LQDVPSILSDPPFFGIEKKRVQVLYYTESDSRIGRCQGGARNLDQALAGVEADKPERFIDADGHKFRGCPTSPGAPEERFVLRGRALAEPILESRAVYQEWTTPET
jgi:hypothetical protein